MEKKKPSDEKPQSQYSHLFVVCLLPLTDKSSSGSPEVADLDSE